MENTALLFKVCHISTCLVFVMLNRTGSILLLSGQISASLAALHRTVEDYDSVARREMLKARQEKAQMYAI